jgi:class III poly(R)-hydroxyalkanoic acid synthase PhaE subunit
MFGTGTGGFGQAGDFEALAKQYWNAWGQAMRGGAGNASAGDWNSAVQWWSQLLSNGRRSPADDLLARFRQQAGDWYGRMQQVAARFAGRDNSAAEIGRAWREALGANAEAANPFADLFGAMQGWGRHGLDGWFEQVEPYLSTLQKFVGEQRPPHLPAFGPAREHQQRWQALADAAQAYQQRNAEYATLLAKAGQKALDLFEARLDKHEAPGAQISSARALFDLWIDAAEEAYAEEALSLEFRRAIGALSNAQMRLRAAVQKEIEQLSGLFGVPTRTEVDAAHRKIAELQRELRRWPKAQPAARQARATPAARPEQKAAGPAKVPPPPKKAVAAKKPATAVAKNPVPKPKKTARPGAAANRTPTSAKVEIVTKEASPPKASRQPKAGRSTAGKKAIPAAARKTAPGAKVVSMKDWVARSIASIAPPVPAASRSSAKPGSGRKGGRK